MIVETRRGFSLILNLILLWCCCIHCVRFHYLRYLKNVSFHHRLAHAAYDSVISGFYFDFFVSLKSKLSCVLFSGENLQQLFFKNIFSFVKLRSKFNFLLFFIF